MKRKHLTTILIILSLLGWLAFTSVQPMVYLEPEITSFETNYSFDDVDDRQSRYVRVFDLSVDPNTRYTQLDFNYTFTSFSIELLENQTLQNVKVTFDNGEFQELNGAFLTEDEKHLRSSFVVPKAPQSKMDLYTGTLAGKIRIFLFYAPPLNIDIGSSLYKGIDSCDKPGLVPASDWREGLPDPVGEREATDVNHIIVHHAASSNDNTNYVSVVRNIYLLHTQSNGWDDIGYNFVVAQDGTIFEGRDHQGVAETDNIKGAHFCGKNSGTMGICMLGNYMETSPSEASLTSLRHLLRWKCGKSNINPIAESRHPTGSDPLLPHVAGHRNGCATACPGDSLYPFVESLRNAINPGWQDCYKYLGVHEIDKNSKLTLVRYGNGYQIETKAQWIEGMIYNTAGMMMANLNPRDPQVELMPGVYIVVLWSDYQRIVQRVVVY